MAEIDPIKVGVMWQKLETMENEVAELRADVKKLLAMAERSKGGLWAGMICVSEPQMHMSQCNLPLLLPVYDLPMIPFSRESRIL